MNHTPISEAYHGDNMDFMRQFPDKFFDLAVVDPPYGIGEDGSKNATRGSKEAKARTYKGFAGGDKNPPPNEYFKELFRVSKNQIIWGGNYFTKNLPASMGWIFWNKHTTAQDFSDGELAFTSFKRALKIFDYPWSGFRQGHTHQSIESRIHPTQKPVALYRWLLENYAKLGDKILDTHMGSQSSRIAAYKMGFDYWGAELDADYFRDGCARFQKEIAEPLFQVENPGIKQTSILDYQNSEQ